MQMYVTDLMFGRNSRVPKSVLCYLMDKVRYSDLETYLNPILFFSNLLDEVELNSLFEC